jgi:hypothetical protein
MNNKSSVLSGDHKQLVTANLGHWYFDLNNLLTNNSTHY